MNYKPKHSYVLVQPYEKTTLIEGLDGKSLNDPGSITPCKVVAVGPGMIQDGALIPACCEVGEVVMANLHSGIPIEDPDRGLLFQLIDMHVTVELEGFDLRAWKPVMKLPSDPRE